MSPIAPKLLTALTAAGIVGAALAFSPVSHAFNFGDMMSPGKWMGGNRDRDRYDDYYDGPYGGPYGGGPYGGPGLYGGPGPYGAPYGGYGPAPYGPPAYRAAPPPAPVAPAAAAPSAPAASSSEIDALKRRIEELESQQRPAPPPASDWGSAPPPSSSSDWGSAPAFRPMGKY